MTLALDSTAMVAEKSRARNLAHKVLRNLTGRKDEVAVLSVGEADQIEVLTWGRLAVQVADCRDGLLRLGVGPGDLVYGRLLNSAPALISFLATASLGAVWCSVPLRAGAEVIKNDPEVASASVILSVDGYSNHGKGGQPQITSFDFADMISLCKGHGSHLVLVPSLDSDAYVSGSVEWGSLFARPGGIAMAPVTPDDLACRSLPTSLTAGRILHITHGELAALALRSLADLPAVKEDSMVYWRAAVGSGDWFGLIGALSLGVAVVLRDLENTSSSPALTSLRLVSLDGRTPIVERVP